MSRNKIRTSGQYLIDIQLSSHVMINKFCAKTCLKTGNRQIWLKLDLFQENESTYGKNLNVYDKNFLRSCRLKVSSKNSKHSLDTFLEIR